MGACMPGRPPHGCRVPAPSSPLAAAQSTNLPSWMLLFRWCFVSHTALMSPLRVTGSRRWV